MYQAYIDYFSNLADQNTELQDFVLGPDQRILSAERADLDFPVLWLEDPDIVVLEDTEMSLQFNTRLLILQNVGSHATFTEQKTALNDTFLIGINLISRIRQDSEEATTADAFFFDFDFGSVRMTPAVSMLNDGDWGWVIELLITSPASHCVDDSVWQDLP